MVQDEILKLSNRLIKLNQDSEALIIKMMSDSNIALISFIENGDSSDFDVDRSYMTIGREDVVSTEEIALVFLLDGTLSVCSGHNLEMSVIDALAGEIVHSDCDKVRQIFNQLDEQGEITLIADGTFTPADTYNELLYSVSEAIRCDDERDAERERQHLF